MLPEKLQLHIEQLESRSGYQRQAALEILADYYEAILFPKLLLMLSDYVLINRQLAAQHLLRWKDRPEISKLCVDYFLELLAIKSRVRIVDGIEDILFNIVQEQLEYIRYIIQVKQGKLSRILFNHSQQYQWFNSEDLLALSKQAKDPIVRRYWIKYLGLQAKDFLLTELTNTKYKDVYFAILRLLVESNWHTRDILFDALHSRYYSIMEYALYYLKKENFDFLKYFNDYPIQSLDRKKIKVRLLQMILLKWDKMDFISKFTQLDQPEIAFSILYQGVRCNYLSMLECIKIIQEHSLKISFNSLLKLRPKDIIDLDNLENLLSLSDPQGSFHQKMVLTCSFPLWDALDWLTTQWAWVKTKEDESVMSSIFCDLLRKVEFRYYAPTWSELKKNTIYYKCNALAVKFGLEDQYAKSLANLRALLLKD